MHTQTPTIAYPNSKDCIPKLQGLHTQTPTIAYPNSKGCIPKLQQLHTQTPNARIFLEFGYAFPGVGKTAGGLDPQGLRPFSGLPAAPSSDARAPARGAPSAAGGGGNRRFPGGIPGSEKPASPYFMNEFAIFGGCGQLGKIALPGPAADGRLKAARALAQQGFAGFFRPPGSGRLAAGPSGARRRADETARTLAPQGFAGFFPARGGAAGRPGGRGAVQLLRSGLR